LIADDHQISLRAEKSDMIRIGEFSRPSQTPISTLRNYAVLLSAGRPATERADIEICGNNGELDAINFHRLNRWIEHAPFQMYITQASPLERHYLGNIGLQVKGRQSDAP
jgi:hypothetical protein